MVGYTVKKVEPENWPEIFARCPNRNFQQSLGYALEISRLQGCKCEFVTFYNDEKLVGAAAVRLKEVPYTGLGIAYVAGGPLVSETGDGYDGNLESILKLLKQEYAGKRKLMLQIFPPVASGELLESWTRHATTAGFKTNFWTAPHVTSVIRLDKKTEQIRKDFHQKWRNQLNASEKKGVKISHHSIAASLDSFRNLFEEIMERKKFSIHLDPEFFLAAERRRHDNPVYTVLLARKGDQVLGVHIGTYCGQTATYLLGAASEEGYTNKVSYLLQWAAIEQAINRGCEFYDTGGLDRENNPGVYRFKTRMSGETIEIPKGYIYTRSMKSRLVAAMTRILEKVRIR